MSSVVISYEAAVHAVEIAAITLTIFNALTAGLTLFFTLRDNYHQQRSWWRLSWDRRLPVYLACSILVSNVVFVAREFLEMGAILPSTSGNSQAVTSQNCVAMNEISWWGIFLISFPE
jgi:hypothetical protein